MLPPVAARTELITGDQMSLDEVLRCWEDLLGLKNAGLIEGGARILTG